MDDIGLAARTFPDFLKRLWLTLDLLRAGGCFLSRKKAVLGTRKLQFLDHMVTGSSLSIPPTHNSVIAKYPTPRSCKDVQKWIMLEHNRYHSGSDFNVVQMYVETITISVVCYVSSSKLICFVLCNVEQALARAPITK